MVVTNGQSSMVSRRTFRCIKRSATGGTDPLEGSIHSKKGGGGLSHPVTGSTGAFNRIEPSFPGASSMSAATTPAEHTPELLHCPCIPNHGR